MLDQLVKLVTQNSSDEIIRNPAIPDEYNDDVIREVGNEINNGLLNEARQGNAENIVAMFKGNTASGFSGNPISKSIVSSITAKLSARFGISPEIANQIAAGLVPKVLNHFTNKTNDPNDKDLDLQQVLENFTGNSDVGNLLEKFTGQRNRPSNRVVSVLDRK